MLALSLALLAVAAVLLLPTVSDLLSLARAPRGARSAPPAATTVRPSLLVLVPAHNEELLIESCLRSLLSLNYPADRVRVVVVADNCTDRTAQLASASGVACLERHDAERRGKPWAIAWAVDRLPIRSYDALVIVDADSTVDPEFAGALAAAAPLGDKAVQPYNDVSNPTDNALTRMAAVLSSVRFRYMNVLKQRAGLNVPLGNGLCIGSGVLCRHGWTAFSICEDWEMYTILTRHGVPIDPAPQARVYSTEASSLRQSSSQRRRWTAGRMTVLVSHSSALLRSRRITLHQKLDAVAELTAPGPAVHLGAALVLSALGLVLHAPGAPWIALGFGLTIVRPVVYTLAALRADPDPARALAAFAYLPLYVIWRLGVQFTAVVTAGRTPWIRTRRQA